MSNMRSRTTASFSTIATSALSIVLLILLLPFSSGFIQSLGQEGNNNDDNALILSGRINSMLMPTMIGMEEEGVMNNSTGMSQMMSIDNTSPTEGDSVAAQAMRYSMARDVAWILNGDWILTSHPINNSGNSTTIFDAEFIKVTTNGTMLHTHRITNFVPLTNSSNIAEGFNSNTNVMTITGKADVYFNDELAWPQADTTLSVMNGTVLMIDIDSEDIDHHFHDQTIYGTVNMLTEDEGFTISLPTPRSIQEKIEEELAELGVNATQVQSAIETTATEAGGGGTFAEEAIEVFDNITNSIRGILAIE
jgi:hypothetical protein